MKTLYCDIDGTICTQEKDYREAQPLVDAICRLNDYYNSGEWRVVMWTARGTTTGIDWRQLTEYQLASWGVQYHELEFGKPEYDLFICDRAKHAEVLQAATAGACR